MTEELDLDDVPLLYATVSKVGVGYIFFDKGKPLWEHVQDHGSNPNAHIVEFRPARIVKKGDR